MALSVAIIFARKKQESSERELTEPSRRQMTQPCARDPHDLMRPFPAEPMRMWAISTRVNKPENDDPSIIEPSSRGNAIDPGGASSAAMTANISAT